MTLRVGIDVSAAVNPASGIGRYTVELCRALLRLDDAPQLVGFRNARDQRREPDLGLPVHNPRWPDRVLRGSWAVLGWPPVDRFVAAIDVFHSSDWVHPPQASGASVTTVHDLGALVHPEWYAPAVVAVHRRKNSQAAERADRIIAISEHTRRTFLELFPVDPARVCVVPNGVRRPSGPVGMGNPNEPDRVEDPPGGSRVPAAVAPPPPADRGRPFVLYLGTRERRKNLPGLIEIFSHLASEEPELDLLIAGARPWREARKVHGVGAWTGRELETLIDRLGLTSRVHVLGRVTEERLGALFGSARCLLFPSLYEGFGLPVLEAMAHGCPVVTSNRTALPEVVGDAGLVHDPDDAVGFADAALRLIRDTDLRERLVGAGRARARQFSWGSTAALTLAVYRSVAGASGQDR